MSEAPIPQRGWLARQHAAHRRLARANMASDIEVARRAMLYGEEVPVDVAQRLEAAADRPMPSITDAIHLHNQTHAALETVDETPVQPSDDPLLEEPEVAVAPVVEAPVEEPKKRGRPARKD